TNAGTVKIQGTGNFAMQATGGAAASRTFGVADLPAANDLSVSANVVDMLTVERQQYTISGTPTTGNYQLTFNMGTTVVTTAPILYNATAEAIRAALQAAVPTGILVSVSQVGASPNVTNTVTFENLPANPTAMTILNSTLSPGAVSNATTPTGSDF